VRARGDGRWTTVGNLDSPTRVRVDAAGLVQVTGTAWSLDWWIGAEDRWHVPAREPAVRQELLGNSPVVVTRLKVPSGDAVQRVYAAWDASGHEALVVEITNESKVPFAVVLAVRPYGVDAPGRVHSIQVDGATVRVDGDAALTLPRSPGRVALSDAAGDSADKVFGGTAAVVGPAEVHCRDGLAQAALLFPLAHTASLRVVLPLTDDAVELDALPDADNVAKGWGVHTRQGARFEVPERRLREAMLASTRFLLLGPAGPAEAAALDLAGFPDEAALALLTDPIGLARTANPTVALAAVARHWAFTHDMPFAKEAAPLVAALVGALPRGAGVVSATVLHDAAGLLAATGEDRGADDLRSLALTAGGGDDPLVDDLTERLADATATWTWPGPSGGHDLAAHAAVVTLVRARLIQEVPEGLALSTGIPEAWLGQGWEVHDAPTGAGRLSYAIRWHGERPALLWELHPHVDLGRVRLSTPTLDPSWSSDALSGEALLAPIPVPDRPARVRGLSIPVTIEPMRRTDP